MRRRDVLRPWLELVPVVGRLARSFVGQPSTFRHPFAALAGAASIREDFLVELARGRRVLHFGFVDAPFSDERIRSGALLHARLRSVASSITGLDVDAAAVERYRALTHDQHVDTWDVEAPPEGRPELFQGHDLILFPETLEHLANPGIALRNLRRICLMNPGSELCLTVPNAFFLGGFLEALVGAESVHPDHYCYYSPRTLWKLLTDCGFQDIRLSLYASPDLRHLPGLIKNGVVARCRP